MSAKEQNRTIMPLIIYDDNFVFPFPDPIFLSDDMQIKAAKNIQINDIVIITTTKDEIPQNGLQGFYNVGTIGQVLRKQTLPNGQLKILFNGLYNGKIISINQQEIDGLVVNFAEVEQITYKQCDSDTTNAILQLIKEKVKALANINQSYRFEHLEAIEKGTDINRVLNQVATLLSLKKEHIYSLFSSDDIQDRCFMILDLVTEEINIQRLKKEIRNKVHDKMDKVNKEYFLKEQLKQIQRELGVENQRDEEITQYLEKLESIKEFLSEDAYKEIQKQINRLSRMHQDSADANILQNYVEYMLEIPFGQYAKDSLSIKKVASQLDSDHFSLSKPKERIIEYFAVRELINKRNKKAESSAKNINVKKEKGTILCFYGPPGVGKTSLANSIATALGRKLVRIALGGLEDVNELRGHRRTYIGAMPGRITQGLIEAKEMNPLIVLDEIDKAGRSYRGDPTSVLLEILDPEQNHAFRDYYNNFNIDLSQAIFIATANDISNIPAPLRDRMEFIEVSSYTPQEKFQIATKYLIPQELKKHGLTEGEFIINKEALQLVIEKYTREAGVRSLRHKIAQIMRKVAQQILQNKGKISITPQNLPSFLDKIVYEITTTDKQSVVGVVNGLAWTSVGGDVLKIEAIKIKGKGNLTLTGSLGEVMKESAHIAHSVVKVLFDNGILESSTNQIYKNYDIHLHVPEGATPKDGPSAGIAMAVAIASILTDRKIHASVAMTGELTLSGAVLPIGGLKEKLIAAYKAGVKTAIIPVKNYERDLKELPKDVINNVKIIGLYDIKDVLDLALEGTKSANVSVKNRAKNGVKQKSHHIAKRIIMKKDITETNTQPTIKKRGRPLGRKDSPEVKNSPFKRGRPLGRKDSPEVKNSPFKRGRPKKQDAESSGAKDAR